MAPGTVNFVNAGLLAEQTGIQVRETISLESGDYRNLIQLIVTEGEDRQFVISGTVLEHKHPRIVQIGDFPIAFMPEGTMAYVPHKNVPGVIGRVGTIMGDYGVNISRMVTSSGDNNVVARLHHAPGSRQRRPAGGHRPVPRDGRDLRDEDHQFLTGLCRSGRNLCPAL